jgi:hypothetical protein
VHISRNPVEFSMRSSRRAPRPSTDSTPSRTSNRSWSSTARLRARVGESPGATSASSASRQALTNVSTVAERWPAIHTGLRKVAATCLANNVFPHPGAPVSVTQRLVTSERWSRSRTSSRPTHGISTPSG